MLWRLFGTPLIRLFLAIFAYFTLFTLKYVILSQTMLVVTFFKVAEFNGIVFGCIGNEFELLQAILKPNFEKNNDFWWSKRQRNPKIWVVFKLVSKYVVVIVSSFVEVWCHFAEFFLYNRVVLQQVVICINFLVKSDSTILFVRYHVDSYQNDIEHRSKNRTNLSSFHYMISHKKFDYMLFSWAVLSDLTKMLMHNDLL